MLLRLLQLLPPRPEHYLWHEIMPPFVPVRLAGGGWSSWSGNLWRRYNRAGYWEYKEIEETAQEFEDRITW